MNRIIGILIGIVALVFSCKKNTEIVDDALIGKWTEGTVTYEFRSDKSYTIKLHLSGSGKDSLSVDSVFGSYYVNSKNSTLHFDRLGHRYRGTKAIELKTYPTSVWEYKIESQTIKDTVHNYLKYRSSTEISTLERVNTAN